MEHVRLDGVVVLRWVREDCPDINLVGLTLLDGGGELGAVLEGLVTNVDFILGGRLWGRGVERGGG